MSEPRCRWVASDQPRAVVGRHHDECPEVDWHPPLAWVDCPGCAPCPLRHCCDCGITHVAALTCPECIGAARDTLAEIVRMHDALPDEAVSRGAQSEAFHLAGPTANPEAWQQRGRYGHRYERDSRLGENHPLWVLGTWDLAVTELYKHRRMTAISVESAADYLGRNLTDLAQDVDFAFDDFANSLRECASHLEAVLHDGEQVERGAPCLRCKKPVTKTTEAGKTIIRCEPCRRTLSDNEYRLAVRAAHTAHADRLNVTDMAERIGVSESAIRRWANVVRTQRDGEPPVEHPPLLRSCGRDGTGRKVYRVADAQTVRDAGDNRRQGATVSNEGVA